MTVKTTLAGIAAGTLGAGGLMFPVQQLQNPLFTWGALAFAFIAGLAVALHVTEKRARAKG